MNTPSMSEMLAEALTRAVYDPRCEPFRAFLRDCVRSAYREEQGEREVGLDEAAQILGQHRDTVRKRAKAGELPHRRVGREYRFKVGDLAR